MKDKGTKEPEHPQDGQLFLKLNEPDKPYSAENTLEVYSEASGNWTVIPLDYCLVTAEGIGAEFRVWDTVTLTGTGAEQAGQWAGLDGDRIVYGVTETTLRLRADPGGEHFYGRLVHNGSSVVWVSMDGTQREEYFPAEGVKAERRVPDLEYLTECDNRVWGCSSSENVIYACKLGDPTNWFSYRGIAADSYAVTVGSDGPFTGAAPAWAMRCSSRKTPCTSSTAPSPRISSSAPCAAGVWPERGPQSLRAERDAVLSLARRRDGVGRQHPGQGVGGAGCRAACQCEAGCGRRAGWPVLSACQPGKRGASAGL